jgi:hypothetical protein
LIFCDRGVTPDTFTPGRCVLRDDILERFTDHDILVCNIVEIEAVPHKVYLEYSKDQGSHAVACTQTFPDIDAHLVESYRLPGADETYDEYEKSGNHWDLLGFAKRICECTTITDDAILKWRDIAFELRAFGAPLMIQYFQTLWPDWEPVDDDE